MASPVARVCFGLFDQSKQPTNFLKYWLMALSHQPLANRLVRLNCWSRTANFTSILLTLRLEIKWAHIRNEQQKIEKSIISLIHSLFFSFNVGYIVGFAFLTPRNWCKNTRTPNKTIFLQIFWFTTKKYLIC